jgi:hypothetical protein
LCCSQKKKGKNDVRSQVNPNRLGRIKIEQDLLLFVMILTTGTPRASAPLSSIVALIDVKTTINEQIDTIHQRHPWSA